MSLLYDVYLGARIPADLAASLEQFANAHEVSSASVVRAALREYIGCKKSPLPRTVTGPDFENQVMPSSEHAAAIDARPAAGTDKIAVDPEQG